MSGPGAPRVARSLVLCGAVLYLLSQVPLAARSPDLSLLEPLDGLVRSGKLALAVILGSIGFLLGHDLLAARRVSLLAVAFAACRWVSAVLVPTLLVCAAALVAGRWDETDTTDPGTTRRSLLRALTFGWNWWQRANVGSTDVRPDLAGMWVPAVLMQLIVAGALTVAILGGRTRLLAGLAVMAAVVCAVVRERTLESDGWVVTAVGTAERADAFLLGLAAAVVAPRLVLDPARSSTMLGGGALVLAGCVLAPSLITVDQTFRVLLPVAAVATAVVVLAGAGRLDARTLAVQGLQDGRLASASPLWAPVVVWAPFGAVTMARHGEHQPAAAAGLIAVVSVMAAAVLTHRLAAETTRWWAATRDQRLSLAASAQVGAEDRGAGGEPPAHG